MLERETNNMFNNKKEEKKEPKIIKIEKPEYSNKSDIQIGEGHFKIGNSVYISILDVERACISESNNFDDTDPKQMTKWIITSGRADPLEIEVCYHGYLELYLILSGEKKQTIHYWQFKVPLDQKEEAQKEYQFILKKMNEMSALIIDKKTSCLLSFKRNK